MGVKVQGNMYCDACQRPVAGQKSTHRLRNAAAVVTAPVTGGASIAGTKAGKWHCPNCGGPVRSLPGYWERKGEERMKADGTVLSPGEEKIFTVVVVVLGVIVLAAIGTLINLLA